MPLLTYTITGALCTPNEGHVTLTVAGAMNGTRAFETKDLKGGVSNAEVAEALLVLLRRHLEPFTPAQIKAGIANGGVTVTTEN